MTGNVIGIVTAIRNERQKRDAFLIQKLETSNELAQAEAIRSKNRNSFSALAAKNKMLTTVGTTIRNAFDEITMYNDFMSRVDKSDRDYHNEDNRIAQLRKKYLI